LICVNYNFYKSGLDCSAIISKHEMLEKEVIYRLLLTNSTSDSFILMTIHNT